MVWETLIDQKDILDTVYLDFSKAVDNLVTAKRENEISLAWPALDKAMLAPKSLFMLWKGRLISISEQRGDYFIKCLAKIQVFYI